MQRIANLLEALNPQAKSRGRRSLPPGGRRLRFERLERRRLLAADFASMTGVVYRDLDGDGLFEPSDGETGIAGAQVELSGVDNMGLVTRPAMSTDSDGVYRFDRLRAGIYELTQVGAAPDGILAASAGQSLEVTVSELQAAGVQTESIDDFTGGTQSVTAIRPGSSPVFQSVAEPQAIGGTRDVEVRILSPTGIATVSVNEVFLPGVLDMNPGSSSAGGYVITWDGDQDATTLDPDGLQGVDLTSGGAATGIQLQAGVDKSGERLLLRVYSDADHWSLADIEIPNTGGTSDGEVIVPFANGFTPQAGGGADFSNVGAVQIEIAASANAMDGQLDLVVSHGPTLISRNFANTPIVTGIQIEKSSNGQVADPDVGPVLAVGERVEFQYVVTNSGNVALDDVQVSEPGSLAPRFQGGDLNQNGRLDPVETWVYVATAVVTAGQHECEAFATGTPVSESGAPISGFGRVSASDVSPYFGAEAGIALQKSANGDDSDQPTGPLVAFNADVQMKYVVTNTGNVPLADVEVFEQAADTIVFVGGDDNSDGLLDVDETWTYRAKTTAAAGQVVCSGAVSANPVDSSGTDIEGLADVIAMDPSHYFGVLSSVRVEKSTNGSDADAGQGPLLPTGAVVRFTYTVTNTGNMPLRSVSLVDDHGTPSDTTDDFSPTLLSGDENDDDLLDLGETWLYESLALAITGQYENRAEVTAIDVLDELVKDEDLSHYFGLAPLPAPASPVQPQAGVMVSKRSFLYSNW